MNLLPPHRRRAARAQLAVAVLRSVSAVLLIYGAVAAITLLTGLLLLERHFRTVVERSSLVLRVDGTTDRHARAARALLRTLERVRDEFTPWTIALAAVTAHLPTEISLTDVAIDRGATLRLEGHVATREDLLAFQDTLEGLPFLREVTIPFSQFLQRERIDFSMDAQLNHDALRVESNRASPDGAAAPTAP